MSEWLRSEIANLMLSECVSSNLTAVDKLFSFDTNTSPMFFFSLFQCCVYDFVKHTGRS